MKKFLVIMLAMLWMSVAAFSQITISQEDYDKLPSDTRTQIEKITTEKAIKGEIKEVSEYANLGKEIGVAVNETLKAVEDSAIRTLIWDKCSRRSCILYIFNDLAEEQSRL